MVHIRVEIGFAPVDDDDADDPHEVCLITTVNLAKHPNARIHLRNGDMLAVIWNNADGTYSTMWRLCSTAFALPSNTAVIRYNAAQMLEWCVTVSTFPRCNASIPAVPSMTAVPRTPSMSDVVADVVADVFPNGVV